VHPAYERAGLGDDQAECRGTVICNKDGHDAGTVTVDSGVKSMAFGNILFGGIIGADADADIEAAFDYPTSMQVIMVPDIRSSGAVPVIRRSLEIAGPRRRA